VTLKHTKEQLLSDANAIKKIKYLYLLSKKYEGNSYLACTMRSCFAKEEKLKNIEKIIDKNIRN